MATTAGFSHLDLLHKLRPWLVAVVELYTEDPAADAATVRERCKTAVLAAQAALRDDKLLREKEGDITRTLVALLDEFGARRFPRFGEWSSIQIELFREAMLGDDVILAMEQLGAGQPEQDPERTFVYYLCLALGFQGCYGDANLHDDGERRRTALRLRLRDVLIETGSFSRTRGEDLSPDRGPAPGPPAPAPAPSWPWLLAFCLLLAVLTEFVALRHFAREDGGEVLRKLMRPAAQPVHGRA